MQDNNEKKSILSQMASTSISSNGTEEFIDERRANLRTKYAEKIVKHMIDLTIWRAQMGDSMLTYIDKVLNQIYNIYQHGSNMLIASRTEHIEELQLILNDEKDMSEAAL